MTEYTLRSARTHLGWMQRDLSARSGVPQQTISRLENGEYLDTAYQTVVRVTRTLRKAGLRGVTLEKLFPVPNGDEA